MATKRMFAKTIIDSDAFLDMPLSTQALYFHLSMRADDDGFVNNPKKIARMIGSNDDDMKVLITKNFILTFDTGVIVIKHWKIHNYIQSDRYKPTVYTEEMSHLKVKDNNGYTLDTDWIQDEYRMEAQISLNKVNIDKIKINKINKESSNKFADDSDEIRLSEYLFSKIITLNPKAKKPNLQTWAKQIDGIIRIDGKSASEICQVIDFATSDKFWQSNILSPSSLRKQFDRLYIQMTTSKRKSSGFERQMETINEWLDESEGSNG